MSEAQVFAPGDQGLPRAASWFSTRTTLPEQSSMRVDGSLDHARDRWIQTVRFVNKPWGHEEIWALVEGKFCGKTLHVTAGHSLSLQYHERKDEMLSVHSGTARVEVGEDEAALDVIEMVPGDTVHFPPGTRHRIIAKTDLVVLEASTTELADVVRLDDHYGRAGT
jgi:mannose-6-phosphate isomerase